MALNQSKTDDLLREYQFHPESMMGKGSFVWPDFYVVGAGKSGTTSIQSYLRKHPQVFIPKGDQEPSFFVTAPPPASMKPQYCTGDLEAYQRLYEDANGCKAVGDKSVGYLWDRNVAERIHAVAPQARIVIILRDPVGRAYSHYHMSVRHGWESLSFLEAMKRDHSESVTSNYWWSHPQMYVELGLYYDQVRRYLEVFGREQVGVYLFEDLETDPLKVMSEICRHIGVDPALLDMEEMKRVRNKGMVPRSKWLFDVARFTVSRKVRDKILPESVDVWLRENPLFFKPYKPQWTAEEAKYLQSIYEPDISRLEELLGRRLPQLRKSWI
jgi:Sulfotransferase domain